jgi:hypothetical protein
MTISYAPIFFLSDTPFLISPKGEKVYFDSFPRGGSPDSYREGRG